MDTITPTPTIVIKTATDAEELQLLHQIQHHTISNTHALLLFFAFGLPIPVAWKLAIYNFLISLPFPQLTPWEITVIVVLWPFFSIALLFMLVFLGRKFFKDYLPVLLQVVFKKQVKVQKKIFLELRFPSDTSKSAYATEQLYLLLHTLARRKSFLEKMAGHKKIFSLEIVASNDNGIRYLLVVDEKDAEVVKRNILSYLPGIKMQETKNYLQDSAKETFTGKKLGIVELKLSSHFALPLATQRTLSEHDPIAYLTGNMTRLRKGEIISFQVITTPVLASTHRNVSQQTKLLQYNIYKRKPLTPLVQKSAFEQFTSLPVISVLWIGVKVIFWILKNTVVFAFSMVMAFVDHSGKTVPFLMTPSINLPENLLNPYEQELESIIKQKIGQHLFETSIRILVASNDSEDVEARFSGLLSSFGTMTSSYQSLVTKSSLFSLFKDFTFNKNYKQFTKRELSRNTLLNSNAIVSSTEMADIYHFPYTSTTKTEDLAKELSPDLPAPLSMKKTSDFEVVFGQNTYGSIPVPIGLTADERSRHMYMIGQTGSGKSTVLFHMAKDDIQSGRGVCVVDPHGDLVEDLLSIIPDERINDVVYINPFDIKHPIGMNLLELPSNLDEDELELEKELVAESVVSIFRRIFSKDENIDAHRIEYILRNTIYTAFYVKDATIFTIYELLTDETFRNKTIATLDNKHLQNFWKSEFGKAGDYQVYKMISGVTAKVGRFLFSPIAKRMLEQSHSTIKFDELLDQGKIILCNLSEGKLGEDTSQLLGTTIITKIHQAILKRSRMDKALRKPFYLYIDEFQTFATKSFTRLLSGSRKYGLRITIAEQSTTQQSDDRVTNVILANVGTVICFRTASPVDETIMLTQFNPLVSKGDIANLPRFHFYMKLGALEPQEPFSGETFPIEANRDEKDIERIITASQENYASIYIQPKRVQRKMRQLKDIEERRNMDKVLV